MKICILYPSTVPIGGVYTHVTNVKHWLEKFGNEVQVPYIEAIKYFGRLHSYLFNVFIAKQIPKIMRECDIVHAMSGGGLSFSFFRKLSNPKVPLVSTYHGSWLEYDHMVRKHKGYGIRDLPVWLLFHPVQEASKLPTLHEADRVMAVSEYMKETLMGLKVLEEKIRVCYNGVDIERFNPNGEIVAELKTRPTVLFVGFLVPRKGIDLLLRSFSRVLKRIKANLVIAGTGRRKIFYENMARRLGVSDYVTFLGYVSDEKLPLMYRTCDVYVLPSLMESFGITLLEAMASGKPVVANNTGATTEIVQHRKTGILVNIGNEEQLASGIVELLLNPKLSERYGKEGRRVVMEKFTWEAVAKRVLQTYEEVLN